MKMKYLLSALLLLCLAVAAAPAQSTSPDGQELLKQAYSQYRAGILDEAFANCTKAIALNPKDYCAHVVLGYIYGGQRKLKNASDSFAAAIRLQPTA